MSYLVKYRYYNKKTISDLVKIYINTKIVFQK